ncbi:MAG: DUF1275 family protein [Candidatus Entotheonellia bacterium]
MLHRPVTLALALEWGILLAFVVGWQVVSGTSLTPFTRRPLIAPLALAMGIQSAAACHLDVLGITTTYITGTLTSLVARLVAGRHRAGVAAPARDREGTANSLPPPRPAHGAGLLTAVWCVYVAGAAAMSLEPWLACVCPAAGMLLVVVTLAVRFRQGPSACP